MTEAIDGIQLQQALAVIDSGLGDLHRRELVSSAEMADLLLDLRSILTFVAGRTGGTGRGQLAVARP